MSPSLIIADGHKCKSSALNWVQGLGPCKDKKIKPSSFFTKTDHGLHFVVNPEY